MRQKNKLAIGKYTKENTVKRTFRMQSVGAEFGEEGNRGYAAKPRSPFWFFIGVMRQKGALFLS